MIKQYHDIKAKHQDCILFFRLGDFYEMFYEDAKVASRLLDLVLTSRGKEKTNKIPMCGIPHHAAQNYITKLIKAGLKVAICEQVEDPAQAKGIVKRRVIRTITSGTFIDETNPSPRYLLSFFMNKESIGIAFTDMGDGTIRLNQYPDKTKAIETISKLPVYECIFPASDQERVENVFKHLLLRNKNTGLSPYDDWCFNPDIAAKSLCKHFLTHNLKGFGINDLPLAVASAGALLEYLKNMNNQPMRHIDKISLYSDSNYVIISPAACYGLELNELIKFIDHTLTPPGKRKIRYLVYHPLKDPKAIIKSQEAVTLLKNHPQTQKNLRGLLRNITDIEKNLSRISCGYAAIKDIISLRNTILCIPEIQKVTASFANLNLFFAIKDIPALRKLLDETLSRDIPLAHPEGKIIRQGYNQELDSLRDIRENGRQWLKRLQETEIKKTGISSLKIGFNRVFGYYIEISKTNIHLVPSDYIRKQTLVGGERFITPQLKEFEEKILSAEEKILKIEEQILKDLKKEILTYSPAIHLLSENLADLDTIYSLSLLALNPGYIVPKITESQTIDIKDGRHPIVEHTSNDPFVPNDTFLDCETAHLLLITGPNMAGKSTYIRQTAILVIMAQIGSYIPASSASIGVVDKIFTRIGAHDEISKGQSTFMIEMNETAEILNNLSSRSLIILDEIGRGTSTYDGLSLAWAIAEYLQKRKVKTLFATHFHELTALGEQERSGIKNYNIAVKEWNGEVIFLHKIIPGGTDDSYGIYVAKLAGIPQEVVQRSKQILSRLEIYENLQEKIRDHSPAEAQLSLFENNANLAIKKMKEELESLDINSLTPLKALNKIQEWKNEIEEKK